MSAVERPRGGDLLNVRGRATSGWGFTKISAVERPRDGDVLNVRGRATSGWRFTKCPRQSDLAG